MKIEKSMVLSARDIICIQPNSRLHPILCLQPLSARFYVSCHQISIVARRSQQHNFISVNFDIKTFINTILRKSRNNPSNLKLTKKTLQQVVYIKITTDLGIFLSILY
ncbi:hypothetical protein PanWU01x14_335860 [Parasponia andersonii]|uniref:Uncharacterized protein n=1 Tax=Parasponia andersonii TaxID=3476 RepID=A0A2P5AG23_PARAD|nr:hypothetical protein PanWU01x14_335860 [Parasponia andersonii]